MKPEASDLTSFKELDSIWAVRKGTAFRAFKRMLPGLLEGRDFVYLNAQRDAAGIERLRAVRRIYPGSINVVMLTVSGVGKLTPS